MRSVPKWGIPHPEVPEVGRGLGGCPCPFSSRAKDTAQFTPPARNNFATGETGNASLVAMGKAAYGQLGGGLVLGNGNGGLRLKEYGNFSRPV